MGRADTSIVRLDIYSGHANTFNGLPRIESSINLTRTLTEVLYHTTLEGGSDR
jgi:hypothetical protein